MATEEGLFSVGVYVATLNINGMTFLGRKPEQLPRSKNIIYPADSYTWLMLLVSGLATTLALLLLLKLERPRWNNLPGVSLDVAMMPLGILVAENHFRWYDYEKARGKGTIIRAAWLLSTGFMVMFYQSVLKVVFF